ncbi:MAG: ATP-binding cassette domain-containing protein [Candidatus Bipolaricaulia bacterium]
MSRVSFDSVSKRYGRRSAVRELTFEVQGGECFGLVGPNGAGKTTALRLLLGLAKPTRGQIRLDGHNPWRRPGARQRVGYLPERSALYPEMTCAQMIAYSARFYGFEPSEDEIGRQLDQVGLRDVETIRVRALSKGMRQRLGLACALVHDPELLILDEPFSGLDPQGRREWQRMLASIVNQDRTVMLSSHDLDSVETLADRVAVLRDGELMALDDLDNLLAPYLDRVHVEIDGDMAHWTERIRNFEGVDDVAGNGSGLNVTLRTPDARSALARQLVEAGGELTDFYLKRPTLDDLFNALTSEAGRQADDQRELSDEEDAPDA